MAEFWHRERENHLGWMEINKKNPFPINKNRERDIKKGE